MNISSTIPAYFSKDYLFHTFWNKETARTFLAVIGAMWLIVEVMNYFFPSSEEFLRNHWGWIAVVVVFTTFAFRRPVVSVFHQLTGRDVQIEIKIGDLLAEEGDYVISTNTTFDTAQSIIASDSIQGQFTKTYYNGQTQHLDTDIEKSLSGTEHEELTGQRTGKSNRYPIGTVAKVKVKQRTCYLLAAMHMNEHGNCEPVSFEQIKTALANLWAYVSRRGDPGHLVMGIIGTGRGRIIEKRTDVAREIIKSFIAACSESTFCERLTLVICSADYRKNDMHVLELGEYLHHLCRYTDWESSSKKGVGTGIA